MVVAAAAAVAAVATVASTAYSLSKKGGGASSTTTQQLEFPEETRRLFQDVELPLLQGSQQEQSQLISPFFGGSRTTPFIGQQYGAPAVNVALAAGRRGAKDAGIGDLGPLYENVAGLSPEFLESLRSLVVQNAAQRTTAVPAGYGQFLSPSTFTSTEGAGPDAFQTGLQIAGALGSAYGSFRNT